MALSTHSELLALLANPLRIMFDKTYNSAGHDTAGWSSYWTIAGNLWPAGATPPTGVGEAPSSATLGAMPLPAVVGGDKLYLAGLLLSQAMGTTIQDQGTVLYDRLVHTSGLNGNLSSAQAINSAALTRHTTGEGVLMFIEIYTAIGSTAAVATIDYTNQSGVAKQTTVSIGTTGADAALQILRVPLAAGDTGVRSVETLTMGAGGTGTVGNFGITLAIPVAMFSLLADNGATIVDWMDLGLPEIDTAACLTLFGNQSGNHSGMNGIASFVST